MRFFIPLIAAVALVAGDGLTAGPGVCYKYDHESHMLAGAATAYAIERGCSGLPQWARGALSLGVATGLGFGKEYFVDKHPSHREAWDWALGAGIVVAARWQF